MFQSLFYLGLVWKTRRKKRENVGVTEWLDTETCSLIDAGNPHHHFMLLGYLLLVFIYIVIKLLLTYPVHWQFSYNVLVGQGQRGDLGLLKNAKHHLMTAWVCVYLVCFLLWSRCGLRFIGEILHIDQQYWFQVERSDISVQLPSWFDSTDNAENIQVYVKPWFNT